MSLQTLQKSNTHQVRICGMIPQLAQKVRASIKDNTQTTFQGISQKIKSVVQNLPGCTGFSVGLVVGSFAKDQYNDSSAKEEVVVYLISDPLDIDSKWMTFVRNDVKEDQFNAIYNALYKYNPL